MPPLRVPERFRSGIIRTVALPQEAFEQLAAAFKKAPACQDTRELSAWIADETPSIGPNDREAILASMVAMFRVQRSSQVSAPVFSDDVWESLSADSPKEIDRLDRQVFISRISSLLEHSSLDLASSRVGDMKREVERNFCKIRVLTDLRPAFRQDLQESPPDMAVIHNFQIGYHDGMGNHKEFYVSLDAGDLDKLKKAIADAESRADTLERSLAKSGIRIHK